MNDNVINAKVEAVGYQEFIQALKEINEQLGKTAKRGKAQEAQFESIDSAIEDLVKTYGDASDSARRYLQLTTSGSSTLLEAEAKLLKARTKLNRILAQSKNPIVSINKAIKDEISYQQKLIESLAAEKRARAALKAASKAAGVTIKTVPDISDEESKAIAAAIAAQKELDEIRDNQNRLYREHAQNQIAITEALVNRQIMLDKQYADAMNRGYLQEKKIREKSVKDARETAEEIEKIQNDLIKTYGTLQNAANILPQEKSRSDRELALKELFNREYIKGVEKRLDDEEAAVQNSLAERMKGYTKEAAEYNKQSDEKLKKDEEYFSQYLKLYGKETAAISKELDSRDAQEQKKKDDQFKEDIARIKKFLALQEDARSGSKSKESFASTSTSSFVDAAIGEDLYKQVKESPDDYRNLADAVDEYEANMRKADATKKKFTETAKSANKTVKEFTLSWQTMGRIIVAQAFNEVFFGLQSALRSSVTEAVELYKAVGAIQTIVDPAARSLVDYYTTLESVLLLSSQINFTPEDTAIAFYDTLSNQIGDTSTEIQDFIEDAGTLAKTTRSSLTQSADAISSVINSYNYNISKSHEVTAQLFAMVDQGRIKLEKVADHLGNVAVPAAQLGIAFEDLVSSLSALTISGVSESEALTLQRNVMFKLIEPTKEMIELFDEWGYSSIEAMIQAEGFTGLLGRLGAEAEKGNKRIADLFGEIRASRGVMGLLGINAAKYEKAQEAVNKSVEAYNEVVKNYVANPGEKFSKMTQQISNELLRMGLRFTEIANSIDAFIDTTDDGQSALASLVGGFTKAVIVAGGAVTVFLALNGVMTAVTTAIGAAATAWTAYTAAASGAAAAGAAATLPIAPIIVAVAAIGAAFTGIMLALAAFGKSATSTFAEIQARAAEANKEIGKSFKEGMFNVLDDNADILAEARKSIGALAQSVSDLGAADKNQKAKQTIEDVAAGLERIINALNGDDGAQKIARVFNDASDNAQTFGDFIDYTNDMLKETIRYHDEETEAIKRKNEELKNQYDNVQDLISSNRVALASDITNRNINSIANPNARAGAQYQAARSAASAGANAADPEESKRLFETAKQFLQDAERSAYEAGTFGSIERHTAFFNQQQADLYALQERRLRAEQEILGAAYDQNNILKQQHYEAADKLNIELQRRELLEEQSKLEQAYLDEYLRKKQQILDSNLDEQAQIEQLNILRQQATAGLDSIEAGAGLRSAFAAENAAGQAGAEAAVGKAMQEKALKSVQAYMEKQRSAEMVVEEFNKALINSATAAQTAAEAMAELNTAKALRGSPGGSVYEANVTDPRITDLLAQLTSAKNAAETGKISSSVYASIVKPIVEKLSSIMKESGIEDSNVTAALSKAQTSIDAVNSLSEVVDQEAQLLDEQAIALRENTEAIKELTSKLPAGVGVRTETGGFFGASSSTQAEQEALGYWDKMFNQVEGAGKGRKKDTEALKKNADDFGDFTWEVIDYIGKVTGLAPVVDDALKIVQNGVARFKEDILKVPPEIAYYLDKMSSPEQMNSADPNKPYTPLPDVQVSQLTPTEQIQTQEQAQVEQKQQILDQELANAQAQAERTNLDPYMSYNNPQGLIGGQDAASVLGPTLKGPLINGRPASEYLGEPSKNKVYDGGYIDGVPAGYMDSQQVQNGVSWGVQQGAQSSIPQAMEQGSYAVKQAVVDGMAEAFRQNQMNPSAPPLHQYFAKGGPVGTDTIPAWLSPGEYVVNAAAAKSNFNWLQAINFGRARRYAEGGPVVTSQSFTNTFNLGSSNPNLQAASIVNAMKRQISQGKATLSKRRPY